MPRKMQASAFYGSKQNSRITDIIVLDELLGERLEDEQLVFELGKTASIIIKFLNTWAVLLITP